MTTAVKLLPPSVFNLELAQCWEALQGGRTIAIYRCLIDVTGSLKTAAMLSQLIYWTRVSKEVAERDGWIYKSISQLESEIGLNKREQSTCKEKLLELNLIQTKRVGIGASLAIKVNLNELAVIICRKNGIETEEAELSIDDLQNRSSLFFRRYFSKRVSYHRDLVAITGCVHSAVILSCVMQDAVNFYTSGDIERQHAFASLTANEWTERIALSAKSQRTARNKLKNLKFIFEKHFIQSRRIFTLVNSRIILAAITKLIGNRHEERFNPQRVKTAEILSLAERAKKDWRKGPNGSAQGFQGDLPPIDASSENMTLRSDKREFSEVTNSNFQKLQTGKLRNDKMAFSETTKGSVLYINYTYGFNYNYKTVMPKINSVAAKAEKVVVVDSADLIYPKSFTKIMQSQAASMFNTLCPKTTTSQRQEILDEIAGQKNEVKSPLGLLNKLCRLAATNQFIPLFAPTVKTNRQTVLLNKRQQHDTAVPKERVSPEEAQKKREELMSHVRKHR